MKALIKGLAIIKRLAIIVVLFVGSLVLALVLALIFPQLGVWLGLALFFVSLVAAIKPLPSIGLRHRGFNIAVAFGVALPVALVSLNLMSQQDMVRLAELKESDPAAYLSELRASDEDKWLTELADIDPEQHAYEAARIAEERAQREAEEQAAYEARRAEAEVRAQREAEARAQRQAEAARIAEERAQREAEERAQRQAEERAQRQAEAARIAEERAQREAEEQAAYIERIDRELTSIPNVRASNYTDSVVEINIALLVIGAWALLYEEGYDLPLDTEAQKKRQRFRRAVIRKQVEMFPALRDAYGPAMRQQMWEADGSARTIGAGYRTVEFVAAQFALNANIKMIHADIRENLMMLRFTRAQYKWFQQASQFSYYTLKAPPDRDIVKWQSGGRFHVLD